MNNTGSDDNINSDKEALESRENGFVENVESPAPDSVEIYSSNSDQS